MIKLTYFVIILCSSFFKTYSSENSLHSLKKRDESSEISAARHQLYDDFNLRLERMDDLSLTSDDKATFRCRVANLEKVHLQNTTFQWYKDNKLLGDEDSRITIRNKPWGSQLKIVGTLTSDSGRYRCEAADGSQRTSTSAILTVSWHRIPESERKKAIDHERLRGKCELYEGALCNEYFANKYIYVDTFSSQAEMERNVQEALPYLHRAQLSKKCVDTASKAFCYYLFSTCDPDVSPVVEKPFCREDCELLKYDICREEFQNAQQGGELQQAFQNTNCSLLPSTVTSSTTADQCSHIGIKRAVIGSHRCYNKTGEDYRGTLSIGSTGESCVTWPESMVSEHPALAGGHNFCRNPNGMKESPWCFVDKQNLKWELCQVPKCDDELDLVVILIPAVSVPLLLGCLILVFCTICRKGNNKDKKIPSLTISSTTKHTSPEKMNIPELMPNNVRVIQELGEGKLGKIFKAQILGNFSYYSHEPVVVKTLKAGSDTDLNNEFYKEIEMFSTLQHVNVASLKAIVLQPSLKCMIFEFTGNVDLHEYLVMHSPQADFAKHVVTSSNMSQSSSNLDPNQCLRIMLQVAAGMDYLANENFIHRDLAARNILVCSNMEMKISNLGLIQDTYLSCYYRSPQGGQMLPIRWMAPESIQNWKFSDKSAVWSYGVLLWEIYSYGMQPYCGYSNHEVLDMIGRRQLLDCPDQCPAKVYSLMIECWCEQPFHRPSFKDIHAKLKCWDTTSTTRMTSQLAHGIHRQLEQIKRDETGQKAGGNLQQPIGIVIDGFPQNNKVSQYQPPHVNMFVQEQNTTENPNVFINLPNNVRDASTVSYHTQPPSYHTQVVDNGYQMMNQSSSNKYGVLIQQPVHQNQSQSSAYSKSEGSVRSNPISVSNTSYLNENLKSQEHINYQQPASSSLISTSNGDVGSPVSPETTRNRFTMPQKPAILQQNGIKTTNSYYESIQSPISRSVPLEQSRLSGRTDYQAPLQQVGNGGVKTPSCDSGLPNEEIEFSNEATESSQPLLVNSSTVKQNNNVQNERD